MAPIPARRQYLPKQMGVAYNRAEIHQQLGLVAQAIPPQITRTVIAAATATTTDDTILCNATAGAFAVTLPLAATVQFMKVTIKKTDSSGNAVTITATGSDRIDGAATVALSTQYKSRTIQSDGSTWYVLASV